MQDIEIWHNPKCSKSRNAMEWLETKNINANVVKYLENTPTKEQLKDVLKKLNMKASQLLRTGEDIYKELNLKQIDDEETLIDFMVKNPILIERPIIIKGNRAVKSLKITILKNGDKIKKDFADLKKKELQSTTKHKQIAQVQIKRIMARTPNIKDPLKYEQKLTQKYLQGTLNFDKDLQIVNQELDKKIFDSI